MATLPLYPEAPADRDLWILSRRPTRNLVDPHLPYAFLVEPEAAPAPAGSLVDVATLFLTNRECPWRCLMCDLWQNTLTETVPPGAIPAQITHALSRLPPAPHIKLYNSGSFFDPHAIPPSDYPAIAGLLHPFERVIVESHPSLVGDRTLHLRDLLPHAQLEVAMGLETVHPLALERSNKRLTLAQFASAAAFLQQHRIGLRVFLLIQPPFVPAAEALLWTARAGGVALECGATAITLISTRSGNGAVDTLALTGDFTPPTLSTLEAVLAYGLSIARAHTHSASDVASPTPVHAAPASEFVNHAPILPASDSVNPARARVFLDLWDIARVPTACPTCQPARIDRLRQINLTQQLLPPIPCPHCHGTPLDRQLPER